MIHKNSQANIGNRHENTNTHTCVDGFKKESLMTADNSVVDDYAVSAATFVTISLVNINPICSVFVRIHLMVGSKSHSIQAPDMPARKYNLTYKSRAFAGKTARCRCKFWYVSNFTTASCGFSATARLSCIHQRPFKWWPFKCWNYTQ